jgi:hypothetical protein
VAREAHADVMARARELAAELGRLGLRAALLDGRVHRNYPCVQVTDGGVRRVHATEFVYLAPDDVWDEGGAWRFWWSCLEPIAADPVAAAGVIAETMACPGVDCPQCAPETWRVLHSELVFAGWSGEGPGVREGSR